MIVTEPSIENRVRLFFLKKSSGGLDLDVFSHLLRMDCCEVR